MPSLLLLENASLRAAADMAEQPWFRLYPLLAAWRPELDLESFVADAKLLAAQPQGFERQLDAVAALRPPGVVRGSWDVYVEDRYARWQDTGSDFVWVLGKGGRDETGEGMDPLHRLEEQHGFMGGMRVGCLLASAWFVELTLVMG